MSKVTEWYPANVKPVRVGVYDIQDKSIRCNCCCTWAHWDGEKFVRYGKFGGVMYVTQEVRDVRTWRGLAEKPA
ncbi:hypothetical protein DM48_346 [Burkholderia gladioli]|uniref:Uncharacterized protein n=1 Tax=Burkholderia gladioli TaxID=28095 RepID=A0AAW3F315_BURGA|nr:hypothetical protein [Burkholderia gladioli]KGC14876.1 hypothetical protein DM48_346 [Burkholderia gladioli]